MWKERGKEGRKEGGERVLGREKEMRDNHNGGARERGERYQREREGLRI